MTKQPHLVIALVCVLTEERIAFAGHDHGAGRPVREHEHRLGRHVEHFGGEKFFADLASDRALPENLITGSGVAGTA